MNIYVSKLNFRTTGESLQALFAQYGEVSSANIITDRETGRSRGFGFVEMPDEGQGQSAIDALNGTDFEGMTIIVNVARPKTEHGQRRRLRRQPRRRWLQPRRLRQKTVLSREYNSTIRPQESVSTGSCGFFDAQGRRIPERTANRGAYDRLWNTWPIAGHDRLQTGKHR